MAEKVITATGRRKTSVARVFLRQGKGRITINDRTLQEYFGRETARMIVMQPFEVTQTNGGFDIDVNVNGGGNSGQAGAIRHGITRALMELNPDFRTSIKKAGFQTMTQRRVIVDALGTVGLNLKLQLETSNQTITVETAASPLQSEDATLGASMGNEVYSALPLAMMAFCAL